MDVLKRISNAMSQMPFGWMRFYDPEFWEELFAQRPVANAFRLNAVLRSEEVESDTSVEVKSQMPFGWMRFYDILIAGLHPNVLHGRKCLSAECGFTILEQLGILSMGSKSQMPFGWMRFYDLIELSAADVEFLRSQMPFGWMRFYDARKSLKERNLEYESQMPFGWMRFYDSYRCCT